MDGIFYDFGLAAQKVCLFIIKIGVEVVLRMPTNHRYWLDEVMRRKILLLGYLIHSWGIKRALR
jgi:hypothetical protein